MGCDRLAQQVVYQVTRALKVFFSPRRTFSRLRYISKVYQCESNNVSEKNTQTKQSFLEFMYLVNGALLAWMATNHTDGTTRGR